MTWLVAFLYDDEFRTLSRIRREREHEPFLPVYRARTGEERPLYPGYMFLRYHFRWPSVLEIQGVARVLGRFEGEQFWPHKINDELIEKLRVVGSEQDDPEIPYAKGDWLRIAAGANTRGFGGCFGVYHEHKTLNPPKSKKGWVAVELDFLGGSQVVYFPPHCVELVEPPAKTPARRSA